MLYGTKIESCSSLFHAQTSTSLFFLLPPLHLSWLALTWKDARLHRTKARSFVLIIFSLLLAHEPFLFSFLLKNLVSRAAMHANTYEWFKLLSIDVVTLHSLHSVPPQSPVIMGLENEEVKAGSFLRVVCMSYGGNPLATLHWTKVRETWEIHPRLPFSFSGMIMRPLPLLEEDTKKTLSFVYSNGLNFYLTN